MRLLLSVRGSGSGAGRDLRRWLTGEPELRGRVRAADEPPPPGAMGAVTDTLVAVLEPGGVAVAFAAAVVAWVRSRRGDHAVTVTRPDGVEITVTSTQVKGLDAPQLAEFVERLAATVDAAPATRDGDDARPPAS